MKPSRDVPRPSSKSQNFSGVHVDSFVNFRDAVPSARDCAVVATGNDLPAAGGSARDCDVVAENYVHGGFVDRHPDLCCDLSTPTDPDGIVSPADSGSAALSQACHAHLSPDDDNNNGIYCLSHFVNHIPTST